MFLAWPIIKTDVIPYRFSEALREVVIDRSEENRTLRDGLRESVVQFQKPRGKPFASELGHLISAFINFSSRWYWPISLWRTSRRHRHRDWTSRVLLANFHLYVRWRKKIRITAGRLEDDKYRIRLFIRPRQRFANQNDILR